MNRAIVRSYRIVSDQGVDLGVYLGETSSEALDAMAQAAGYADEAEAEAVSGPFSGVVSEVQS